MKTHEKIQGVVDELADRFELTEREQELLPYFLTGLVYEDIAKEAIISYKTVKNHAANLFRKLKVKNRQELMVMVIDRILVEQEGEE